MSYGDGRRYRGLWISVVFTVMERCIGNGIFVAGESECIRLVACCGCLLLGDFVVDDIRVVFRDNLDWGDY